MFIFICLGDRTRLLFYLEVNILLDRRMTSRKVRCSNSPPTAIFAVRNVNTNWRQLVNKYGRRLSLLETSSTFDQQRCNPHWLNNNLLVCRAGYIHQAWRFPHCCCCTRKCDKRKNKSHIFVSLIKSQCVFFLFVFFQKPAVIHRRHFSAISTACHLKQIFPNNFLRD